jgi:hypothetical protein
MQLPKVPAMILTVQRLKSIASLVTILRNAQTLRTKENVIKIATKETPRSLKKMRPRIQKNHLLRNKL